MRHTCLCAVLAAAFLIVSPAAVDRAAARASPAASPTACATPAIAASTPMVASPKGGTPTAADATGRMDTLLTNLVSTGQFSGSVLVASGGQILLAKGYGFADRACAVPNTPETTFRIGSVTKQFTALAVLQLEEQGLLSVDDPVVKHLPDFPAPAPDGPSITIHQLLSHTSGIPEVFAFYSGEDQASWPATVREIAYDLAAKPLDFAPGTHFAYSNTNYLLLGLLIEAVAGEPYETFISENIFTPLGTEATGFEDAGDPRPHPANGYAGAKDEEDISGLSRIDIAWSAGGLFSSVLDLYRWDRAFYTETLASAETLARMNTPVMEGYAYGVFTGTAADHEFVGHNGSIDGFVSYIQRFPADDAVVIVLANQQTANLELLSEALPQELFAS